MQRDLHKIIVAIRDVHNLKELNTRQYSVIYTEMQNQIITLKINRTEILLVATP